MTDGGFLTIEETARTLGVSTRHVRRLADDGSITRVARGLIDGASVDRYQRSQRQGRTRAWAEHTAWAAVAILAWKDADWLGATQASRLRRALRETSDVNELLARMRDRARVHTFVAHRAALPRLHNLAVTSNLNYLGITDAVDDSFDGYVSETVLDDLVRSLGLRADAGGTVALRATRFDFAQVRELVDTAVVAALDAAASPDPRLRGLGQNALRDLLEAYR